MGRTDTEKLIADFLAALNGRDMAALAALLHPDAVHDAPDGARSVGAEALREWFFRQAAQFEETIADIVAMSDASGMHGAAEFTRRGLYRTTAPGLPAAAGQRYALRDALLFEAEDGRITRVSAPGGREALARALAGR